MARDEWILKPAAERVDILGHRGFVGGGSSPTWFGIGRLQYHFLVSQGLRPHHKFLDVACGSLRLGQYLIPFLETGNYYGLEAEPALVAAGLREEMLFDLETLKKPMFGFGYGFDFSFVPGFDFAIAQSLFTHLTPKDIGLCLRNLAGVAGPDSMFFFTFHEGDRAAPADVSDAQKNWHYSFDQLRDIAEQAGWAAEYIGDWKHPRDQKIVRAKLAAR